MANKAKKPAKKAAAAESNVVRIKAGASTKAKKTKAVAAEVVETAATNTKATKTVKAKKPRRTIRGLGFFAAIGGYFKGAWVELRQVRWPNRRATWSLTGAVLAYSAFFIAIVLLLDAGFKYLFELILGK